MKLAFLTNRGLLRSPVDEKKGKKTKTPVHLPPWPCSPSSTSPHVRPWGMAPGRPGRSREGSPGSQPPPSWHGTQTVWALPSSFPEQRARSGLGLHPWARGALQSLVPSPGQPSVTASTTLIHPCCAHQASPHLQPEPKTFHNLCGFGRRSHGLPGRGNVGLGV